MKVGGLKEVNSMVRAPRGLRETVGETMHVFLMSQLEQIAACDEDSEVADCCFAKVMECLYKREVDLKYLKYYEALYDGAGGKHGTGDGWYRAQDQAR